MAEFEGKTHLEGTFGQCLTYLMFVHGTRPDGSPDVHGGPWVQARFAELVGVDDRTVRYWLDDKKAPSDLRPIERVLFGENKRYDVWRMEMRAAHERARKRRARRQVTIPDMGGDATIPSKSPLARPAPPLSHNHNQILHREIRAVPGFTGRKDLLAKIEAALWHKGGTAALTNDTASAAVKGLGGVGKSVLAREYAWRARGRYHAVWWVRAETEQTLIDDLIDLGSRLIPNLKEMRERERALDLALDVITAASGDKPWLIVYDNVEKPGAIRKLKPREHAHILITSRWPDWQDEAWELPVDVFTENVAIDYLLAKRPRQTREAAGHLADKLGYLPLALTHARAYCTLTNLSFDDYRRRLSELIQEVPADAEYPTSVHATFNIALAKAVEACPEAEKLMAIAAFLAPERIPLDIFTTSVMSEKQRDEAVAALFKVSLITHDTTEAGMRVFNVHRLVQVAALSRQNLPEHDAQYLPLRLLASEFQRLYFYEIKAQGKYDWPRIKLLDSHVNAVLEHTKDETERMRKFQAWWGISKRWMWD
jgi:hypothetical protein